MSKNALALVDCGERDILFQFLTKEFDRKTVKNEMISPYDDQLIGKMNFSYRGVEHSMFFTYARASEYPGMRFRNHKIIYLSLGVSEISSEIFTKICSHFGGFLDHNDDLETGWQKIERQITAEEELLGEWSEQVAAEEAQSALQEHVQAFRENQKPGGERKESRRKEGKQQEQRRRSEKSERREDVRRGQRHERREDNRTEKKGNPRNRSERPASKKAEQRMTEKQEKAAGNESQS